MSEEWRVISGYPDYEVSSEGRVRSWRGRSKGKILRFRKVANGWYWGVKLFPGPRFFTVHQLVLEAFVGPRPPGLEARHLNNNPLDNRLVNLKWGTRSENMLDRSKHGTFIGELVHTSKLTEQAVVSIRQRYIRGINQHQPGNSRALALEYGVDQSLITYIVNRRGWTYV